MANRVKGITIEIGGDTTKLSKAMSGVNKNISGTKSQLKDVERLLKLDPSNTELLSQKQKLLSQAVGDTKTKLDTLKTAEKQAQEQFAQGKISQEQYNGLQREIVATEQDLKTLEQQARNSNTALNKMSNVSGKIANAANTVSEKTRGISTAAGGAVVALGGVAYKAMASADDLATMARNTGFSTQELQKMQYSAELVDVSVDDMTKAAAKMKKNMVSSSKDTVEAFKKIGVATKNNNGSLRNSTDVFYDCLDGLSKVKNGTERDTLAMQLFGKSADQLSGIVDDGGAALKKYGQQAVDSGSVMSQETIDNLTTAKDKIDTMKNQAIGALAQDGAKLLTVAMPLFEKIINGISGIISWLGSLDTGTLQTIVTSLLVIAAISPVAGLIGNISSAIGFLTSTVIPALSGALAFLAANPIVLIIAAIVAVIAAIAIFGDQIQNILGKVDKFLQGVFMTDFTKIFGPGLGDILNGFMANFKNLWNGIKGCLNGIIDIIRGVFTGDWKRAWKGVQEAFKGVWDTLVACAKAPINGIIALINGAISGINFLIGKVNKIKIKIPDWVPYFGGKNFGFNLGEIGKIPYLANGGTLHSGSAVVGEAGPELLDIVNGGARVTPLTHNQKNVSNFGGVTVKIENFTNNTESDINQIADKISARIQYNSQRAGAVFA